MPALPFVRRLAAAAIVSVPWTACCQEPGPQEPQRAVERLLDRQAGIPKSIEEFKLAAANVLYEGAQPLTPKTRQDVIAGARKLKAESEDLRERFGRLNPDEQERYRRVVGLIEEETSRLIDASKETSVFHDDVARFVRQPKETAGDPRAKKQELLGRLAALASRLQLEPAQAQELHARYRTLLESRSPIDAQRAQADFDRKYASLKGMGASGLAAVFDGGGAAAAAAGPDAAAVSRAGPAPLLRETAGPTRRLAVNEPAPPGGPASALTSAQRADLAKIQGAVDRSFYSSDTVVKDAYLKGVRGEKLHEVSKEQNDIELAMTKERGSWLRRFVIDPDGPERAEVRRRPGRRHLACDEWSDRVFNDVGAGLAEGGARPKFVGSDGVRGAMYQLPSGLYVKQANVAEMGVKKFLDGSYWTEGAHNWVEVWDGDPRGGRARRLYKIDPYANGRDLIPEPRKD